MFVEPDGVLFLGDATCELDVGSRPLHALRETVFGFGAEHFVEGHHEAVSSEPSSRIRQLRSGRSCSCPSGQWSASDARRTIARVLRRLRIENLVLIREAELELAPGLNAITGETGAGKTILAQALGLLLGAKGGEGFVGAAGEEAYVEAELDLPAELDALGELRPEDEDALRRLPPRLRRRAHARVRVGAEPPRGRTFAAAVESVVAMSGQFEQRRLARPSYQLEVLDRFCGDEQLARRARGA